MAALIATAGNASASDPPYHAVAVTPSDSTDLVHATTSVYIGTGGNMQVTMLGGETVTYVGLLSGTRYGMRVTRIWSTLTSATGLVAEWREA